MRKIVVTFISVFLIVFSGIIPAKAEEIGVSISSKYLKNIKLMSDETIQEKIDLINLKYEIEEPFEKDDELFIRALAKIEQEETELSMYTTYDTPRILNFNFGPAKGWIDYTWYHYSRTIITTGYYGKFNTYINSESRPKLRLYSLTMDFTAYGILGDGGIGKIKSYNEVSNFVISTGTSYYKTNFDTWSYSPVLYSTSKLTLKFTSASQTYTKTETIKVR